MKRWINRKFFKMGRQNFTSGCPVVCIILIQFIAFVSLSSCQSHINDGRTSTSSSTKAFFIFGDSTVDSGNNNYINTTPENKADYKPYGQNGFFKEPTGRFSNGRVMVDFIAEYAKLPLIPPFLQPNADYSYGVNFASGGAGALAETNQGLVIDLLTQLSHFEEVRKSLVEKLGENKAKELISEAVYFISIGSNDYISGYLGNPKMQESYSSKEYVWMVISNLTRAIFTLHDKGARKFGFLNLPPLGYFPALRALNPEANKRGCYEAASVLAKEHNDVLKLILTNLVPYLEGFMYSYPNFYSWLGNRIDNPMKYGFKDGVNACCGSGPYGGTFTCGDTKNVREYNLCDNVGDYIWWDSFHVTEKIHEQLAKMLWNERPCSAKPYNLQDFFSNDEIITPTIGVELDSPKTQQGQFQYSS